MSVYWILKPVPFFIPFWDFIQCIHEVCEPSVFSKVLNIVLNSLEDK